MIVDYTFYEKTYFGDSIEESSFLKWESRAEEKLKAMCSDNLDEEVVSQFEEKVQKAVCALADTMYKIDFATTNASNPTLGNVKSMSSGGQSVSFGNNETLVTKVLSDKKEQEKLMLDSVRDYLCGTGLLFMGV